MNDTLKYTLKNISEESLQMMVERNQLLDQIYKSNFPRLAQAELVRTSYEMFETPQLLNCEQFKVAEEWHVIAQKLYNALDEAAVMMIDTSDTDLISVVPFGTLEKVSKIFGWQSKALNAIGKGEDS